MAKQLSQQYPETHFLLVGDPYPGYEPILEEIHEEKKIITLTYAKQLNIDVDNAALRKRMIGLYEKEKLLKEEAKVI